MNEAGVFAFFDAVLAATEHLAADKAAMAQNKLGALDMLKRPQEQKETVITPVPTHSYHTTGFNSSGSLE